MSSIYKAYDIRGRYPEEIDEALAEQIGRAFAAVLARLRGKPAEELRIGLGRDMRLSAPAMSQAIREGMMAAGAEVLDAGMVPTEAIYFLVGRESLDGGAIVTASHNPKAYSGVKLVREGALPLSGEAGIDEIRALIEGGAELPAAPGGSSREVDVTREFRAHALSMIEADRIAPLRVVVDGGNGMAGPVARPILTDLGLDLVELYFEPDGNFPDHEPNPLLEENRRLIMEQVTGEGADLGIAWDGDADRCFFIDDRGRFCDGDFICALLARRQLEAEPGGTVLYDPRSSRAVPDTVAAAGGRSALSRVGHAFFKRAMRDHGAVFGGEVSGHYYFRDFWCADSGLIPALLILELVSREQRPLSALIEEFRARYFISGEINSEVPDPAAKIAELERLHPDARISHLDGVSVDYEDWHFNVRPSNTEPLLRLNLESLVSPEDMERRRDEVLEVIRR